MPIAEVSKGRAYSNVRPLLFAVTQSDVAYFPAPIFSATAFSVPPHVG